MNIKNMIIYYDINRSCPPGRIVVSHDCDVNTRTVEVFFRQGVIPLAISTDCTAKAAFVERQTNILINDNVPCTVSENGTVLIPVDNLHRQGRFDMSIELTVTNQDGEQVLVTPFPMWITVNGSILNEAEVTEESKGTVPELLEAAGEALAEAKDYEKLDNLPAINGHTLIGDQTAEDLGVQDKLTAGENITIDENGVISAEDSGVISYTELTDKPSVRVADIINPGTVPKWTFENVLHFQPREFEGMKTVDGTIDLRLDSLVFKGDFRLPYDFNNIGGALCNGFLRFGDGISGISNFPSALSDLDTTKMFYVLQCLWSHDTGGYVNYMIRKVVGQSLTGEYLEYAQYCRILIDEPTSNVPVTAQTGWVKLSGGSEIVSGVVNQNGTITFYDKDGNQLFTTTGASVIGPQGPQGIPGDNYVLTAQDKTDIATIVLKLLPTTEGVEYGN